MKPIRLLAATILTLLTASITLAATKAPSAPAADPAPPQPGQRAPSFSARTLSGRRIRFPQNFRGKLVLVDFWATWCPTCVAEIPQIRAAYHRFHSRGFDVISINVNDPNQHSQVKQFIHTHKMTWPQLHDGDAAIAGPYNVHPLPEALLINGSTGKVVAADDALMGPHLSTTLARLLAHRA